VKHHRPPHEPKPPETEPAAPPAEASEAPPPAAPQTESEVEKLRAELAAAKDGELRARAELENFRKRSTRELEERLRYANLPLVRDLLPVADNLDRAIDAAGQTAEAAALLEGVQMARLQFDEVLKRHHCTRIEALGQPFDPNVHHAILQQPSKEHPANTVLLVAQNGYQLHDRVVRPCQVIVSSGPPEQDDSKKPENS